MLIWPTNVPIRVLEKDQVDLHDPSSTFHHHHHHHRELEMETTTCSEETIQCVLMHPNDRSLYNNCGRFRQPTDDDRWCQLPVLTEASSSSSSSSSKTTVEFLCCSQDLADCCQMKVGTIVGISYGALVIVVILVWALRCLWKDVRAPYPMEWDQSWLVQPQKTIKPDSSDMSTTSGDENEHVETKQDSAVGSISSAKKENCTTSPTTIGKKQLKHVFPQADKIKAHNLARPKSQTEQLFITVPNNEDATATATVANDQIPPSLSYNIVPDKEDCETGQNSSSSSPTTIPTTKTTPSLVASSPPLVAPEKKHMFIASTAPAPKEVQPPPKPIKKEHKLELYCKDSEEV